MHTEQELVFVDNVSDSEIKRTKCHDLRLNNAIGNGDSENEDSLWIYSSIVDHRWSIELSKVYRTLRSAL